MILIVYQYYYISITILIDYQYYYISIIILCVLTR